MICRLLSIGIGLFYGMSAMASGRIVGNGGDLVVCPQSVELLDHYEAKVIRGLTIQLGGSELSVMDKVHIALQRLYRLSPGRAEIYQQWANSFFKESQILHNIELIDIPDSQHIVLPKGCVVRQLANQATQLLPGQKRYTIDGDLYRLMNKDQKAGLVIHELVYREALQLGHIDSVAARWLGSLMASDQMDSLSVKEFLDLLLFLNFPNVQVQNVWLQLFKGSGDSKQHLSLTFHNDQVVHSGVAVEDSLFHNGVQNWFVRGPVLFFENGKVESLYLARKHFLSWKETIFELAPQLIRFYPSGNLSLAILGNSQEVKVHEGLSLVLNGHLEFYDNGNIYRARVQEGQFSSLYGKMKVYQQVQLYPNGQPLALKIHPFKLPIDSHLIAIDDFVYFYESGHVRAFHIRNGELQWRVQKRSIWLSRHALIELYESGQLFRGELARGIQLKTAQGDWVTLSAGQKVTFTETGEVQRNSSAQ
ncbi:MAG: hypothetical protein KDD61_02875 [Bdellovibrionales bacterium]|nr:hypothetical protein [Bdellovibrionales bacterium]